MLLFYSAQFIWKIVQIKDEQVIKSHKDVYKVK